MFISPAQCLRYSLNCTLTPPRPRILVTATNVPSSTLLCTLPRWLCSRCSLPLWGSLRVTGTPWHCYSGFYVSVWATMYGIQIGTIWLQSHRVLWTDGESEETYRKGAGWRSEQRQGKGHQTSGVALIDVTLLQNIIKHITLLKSFIMFTRPLSLNKCCTQLSKTCLDWHDSLGLPDKYEPGGRFIRAKEEHGWLKKQTVAIFNWLLKEMNVWIINNILCNHQLGFLLQ